jgi:hypothetical protein
MNRLVLTASPLWLINHFPWLLRRHTRILGFVKASNIESCNTEMWDQDIELTGTVTRFSWNMNGMDSRVPVLKTAGLLPHLSSRLEPVASQRQSSVFPNYLLISLCPLCLY